MPISAYPQFNPLVLKDRDVLNRVLQADPPIISEFTFTNLYSWREAYRLQAAMLNDCILLRSDAAGQSRFFYPIGSGDKPAVMARVMEEAEGVFIRVPETAALLFIKHPRITVTEDRDNADYLYRMADLVDLAGQKYDGKRNLIKKFKSKYSYAYIKLGAANADICLAFEDIWCSIKNCDSNAGLSQERQAIREMAGNFARFGLIGGAITVDGKVCAAAIGQRLNAATLVMHVLKADPNMPGLYQVINNEFLAREGRGFEYVNLEQDLGIEGLRKSKLSYHPCELIKKYTLRKSVQ